MYLNTPELKLQARNSMILATIYEKELAEQGLQFLKPPLPSDLTDEQVMAEKIARCIQRSSFGCQTENVIAMMSMVIGAPVTDYRKESNKCSEVLGYGEQAHTCRTYTDPNGLISVLFTPWYEHSHRNNGALHKYCELRTFNSFHADNFLRDNPESTRLSTVAEIDAVFDAMGDEQIYMHYYSSSAIAMADVYPERVTALVDEARAKEASV